MDSSTLHFFLGANSAQGFVSRFDQLGEPQDGWRCYVIKGGPGTGKSSLMKRLATHLQELGQPTEQIHCSSDVDSLDGIIFPQMKVSIADGTPPHTIEPEFPGAYENIISIFHCWDKEKLFAQREQIITLSRHIGRCHKNAVGYLYAAGSLFTDLQMAVEPLVDSQKIFRFAHGLAQREFPKKSGQQGKESIRFLSAVTNKRVVTFNQTLATLAPRLFILEDSWGVASQLLITRLRHLALDSGCHVISCCSPLFPFSRIDHLILPELGTGFATQSRFHLIEAPATRTIHARRFTDMEALAARKHRISFLQKAARNMIDEAGTCIAEAKALHDQLENYYIDAMNFDKLDAVVQQMIEEFTQLAQQTAKA